MRGDILLKHTSYNAKNLSEAIYMKDTFLLILIVLYLGFSYWAVQYVKVHILGITEEWTNNLIAFYGQRIIFAAILGWAAIPIALIHKTFIAK